MNQIEDNANKRMSKNKSSGHIYTILGVIVIIVLLVSLILISLPPVGRPDWVMCATNVSGLGKAIYMYRSDYDGQYPQADKWCDLLVMNYEVKLEYLVCKGSDAKIGESSYALNKNIAGKNSSEIPKDTVVLFETNYGKNPLGRDGTLGDRDWYKSLSLLSERGDLKQHKHSEKVYKLRWNQFGGPDMLTTENHKGEGCNVVFGDWHVEYVKAERIGELKWDTEEKDSESIE